MRSHRIFLRKGRKTEPEGLMLGEKKGMKDWGFGMA